MEEWFWFVMRLYKKEGFKAQIRTKLVTQLTMRWDNFVNLEIHSQLMA